MNAKRLFFGLIGLLVIMFSLGIGAIVIGNQMMQKQSSKLIGLKLQSQVLANKQTGLEQAKQEVTKYTPLNTVAETIVPQDKDQALTVRQIVAFAGQAGISVGGITFPASSLGLIGVGGAVEKSTDASDQLQPVPGIAGVYEMPITVSSDTNNPTGYPNLIAFLQLLENDRHTAEVSQITITPTDTSGNTLSFQIVLNVYIKP